MWVLDSAHLRASRIAGSCSLKFCLVTSTSTAAWALGVVAGCMAVVCMRCLWAWQSMVRPRGCLAKRTLGCLTCSRYPECNEARAQLTARKAATLTETKPRRRSIHAQIESCAPPWINQEVNSKSESKMCTNSGTDSNTPVLNFTKQLLLQ